MKLGKVSEAIQKRCIINIIKYRGRYTFLKPKMGDPTGAVENHGGDLVISAMATASGDQKDLGIYAITRAVNDILCRCAEPTGVQVMVHLPERAKESSLKAMVQCMEEFCANIQVPLINIQATATSTITTTHITVTALGEANKCELGSHDEGVSGQDIIMIGEVGLEGALRVLSEKRASLESRFAPAFLRTLDHRMEDMAKSVGALKVLNRLEEKVMHQVPESGVLGALWELAEASGVGVEVQLREIPIAQEVIEVCEYIGINPYRLGAAGTIVVLTHDGKKLVEKMGEFGYKATMIGKAIQGNEKILCNGDDVRHLERPTPNELYKVLEERQEEEC